MYEHTLRFAARKRIKPETVTEVNRAVDKITYEIDLRQINS